jgi:hypothetical protein
MNAKLTNQQQNRSIAAFISDSSDSFDFDLWASQVRRQMIAVLQKRDSERDVKAGVKGVKQR